MQTLEVATRLGLMKQTKPPTTEDEVIAHCADYAEGFVDGKWDLIRGQCRVCHTTEALVADDTQCGLCEICGMGYCSPACQQQHVLVDHTLG